ncbi:GRAS domain family protein [Catalinimonas alkaloidigena]|uniref:GRAS domain family protein n=1 Tax=Catalinimonas alkaloidigena TaxID=1075417 RepID=A0A1G9SD35_9BACT|nr:GRAS family protein [Catalinimonas alkaloidigena]SDM33302.1 GRAS domain family protein [Catalinimonas alkaloidigena]
MPQVQSSSLQYLASISQLIAEGKQDLANELLDGFTPDNDIARLCAQSLRDRNTLHTPLYAATPDEADKQINVFDLVLKAVPPVQVLSGKGLQVMKELYCQGMESITHLNIGIGKGFFEAKLLEEMALQPEKLPSKIKIIGIDIDEESLYDTGVRLQQVIDQKIPATTTVEYIPICAFVEHIPAGVWDMVRNHGADVLGVVSAFTLHHIPTLAQRSEVMKKISDCDPLLFVLIEPDSDHFTENLPERLVNCWHNFGTIFKLIDRAGLQEHEARAIKYTFFGREIKDILGNDEAKRSEKHEPAQAWARRLTEAGFNLHPLVEDLEHSVLTLKYKDQLNVVTTEFEGTPIVALMMASRQV